jgi:hypothetical protein
MPAARSVRQARTQPRRFRSGYAKPLMLPIGAGDSRGILIRKGCKGGAGVRWRLGTGGKGIDSDSDTDPDQDQPEG